MHHPLSCNASSGSNSTPSVLPYGGQSTSVGPTVNTPSDSSISSEQPCGLSQLTYGILLQANECSDDGQSVLLYQARLWLFLLQQYAPDSRCDSQGVILLHNNARPHVAKIVQETLAKKNWEVLHHPAYSPDLSPCDFHLFGPLKKALKGQRFNSDADVKTAVTTWFSEQPRTFFSDGIRRLPKQWDACLNAYGDFF